MQADPVRAAELYTLAAEQGYAPAQCNLAVCYLNAIGVEKDCIQATAWLQKAAEQDYAAPSGFLGAL